MEITKDKIYVYRFCSTNSKLYKGKYFIADNTIKTVLRESECSFSEVYANRIKCIKQKENSIFRYSEFKKFDRIALGVFSLLAIAFFCTVFCATLTALSYFMLIFAFVSITYILARYLLFLLSKRRIYCKIYMDGNLCKSEKQIELMRIILKIGDLNSAYHVTRFYDAFLKFNVANFVFEGMIFFPAFMFDYKYGYIFDYADIKIVCEIFENENIALVRFVAGIERFRFVTEELEIVRSLQIQ